MIVVPLGAIYPSVKTKKTKTEKKVRQKQKKYTKQRKKQRRGKYSIILRACNGSCDYDYNYTTTLSGV